MAPNAPPDFEKIRDEALKASCRFLIRKRVRRLDADWWLAALGPYSKARFAAMTQVARAGWIERVQSLE